MNRKFFLSGGGRAAAGITLPELLVVCTLIAVIALCAVKIFMPALRLWRASGEVSDSTRAAIAAIRRIDRELRLASCRGIWIHRSAAAPDSARDSVFFISPVSPDGRILSDADSGDFSSGNILWRNETVLFPADGGDGTLSLCLYRNFSPSAPEEMKCGSFASFLRGNSSAFRKTVLASPLSAIFFDAAVLLPEGSAGICRVEEAPVRYTIYFTVTSSTGEKKRLSWSSSVIPLNGKE